MKFNTIKNVHDPIECTIKIKCMVSDNKNQVSFVNVGVKYNNYRSRISICKEDEQIYMWDSNDFAPLINDKVNKLFIESIIEEYNLWQYYME